MENYIVRSFIVFLQCRKGDQFRGGRGEQDMYHAWGDVRNAYTILVLKPEGHFDWLMSIKIFKYADSALI
jgi:hypothetical protein